MTFSNLNLGANPFSIVEMCVYGGERVEWPGAQGRNLSIFSSLLEYMHGLSVGLKYADPIL